MYYYGDPTYILIIIGFVIALAAQAMVKSAFRKWSDVPSSTGMTGRDIARQILDANGLSDIPIQHIAGDMTDSYDPENNVLNLSDTVYNVSSVAALGVAAHECGHAIQDAKDYLPLRFRSNLVPFANIGSEAAFPLLLLGLFLSFEPLQQIGIYLFLFSVLFYLVTLPVEFNASGRAIEILKSELPDEEMQGVRSVLFAAAMTYVASALQAILQMVRLILLSRSDRRRD
ncbi:MAG: zinc metallopeptidase [Clostridia bacterium]|nr:zinc metallopeptidase [Clostridia bacterium]